MTHTCCLSNACEREAFAKTKSNTKIEYTWESHAKQLSAHVCSSFRVCSRLFAVRSHFLRSLQSSIMMPSLGQTHAHVAGTRDGHSLGKAQGR